MAIMDNQRMLTKDVEFGNKVKLARVALDLTQAQLAERVGVTRQTIGLLEAGKYNPSLKLCLKIAAVTQQSLDKLFWIKEPQS